MRAPPAGPHTRHSYDITAAHAGFTGVNSAVYI